MKKRYTVKVGTQFRASYADANPLWTVIESRGRGTWIAEIKDDADYAGAQSAFTTEQIASAAAWEDTCRKSMDDSESFFENLSPGSLVHYSNGFNQYVRCQVTQDKQLLPIALVGQWRDYDLPKRQADGTVYNGYHADQIFAHKTFRPHASNVWECKQHPRRPNDIDPTGLAAIDLSVPPMTPEQENTADLWQTINKLREATHVDYTANPNQVLRTVNQIIEKWADGRGQFA